MKKHNALGTMFPVYKKNLFIASLLFTLISLAIAIFSGDFFVKNNKQYGLQIILFLAGASSAIALESLAQPQSRSEKQTSLDSSLSSQLGDLSSQIGDLSSQIEKLESNSPSETYRVSGTSRTIKEAIDEFIKENKDREIALAGLKEGFTENDDGNIPFLGLIGEACNYALEIEKSDYRAMPLYKDIRVYLEAWLVSSIRHNVVIEIQAFIQPKLDGIESYKGKETYIKTIKFIKDIALKKSGITHYFSTPGSRKIVEYYLQELIAILVETEEESTLDRPIEIEFELQWRQNLLSHL